MEDINLIEPRYFSSQPHLYCILSETQSSEQTNSYENPETWMNLHAVHSPHLKHFIY